MQSPSILVQTVQHYIVPQNAITQRSIRPAPRNFTKLTLKNISQRGERHEPTHNELKDRKKLVALLHQYNNDAPKSQSSYEDKTNTGQEWKYMAPKGVEDSLQSLQSEFNIEDLHKLNMQINLQMAITKMKIDH